jgi:transketolase
VPVAVVARTMFGKGVSYMEGQLKWHYWPMSDNEYQQALEEVGALKCAWHSSVP